MQKPWYPCPFLNLEPAEFGLLQGETQNQLSGQSVEFVSLGFEYRGDYRLEWEDHIERVRFFQSADGALLGRINEPGQSPPFEFASILADGTYVRSIPCAPVAPWNCCRFPVHVIFGPDCGIEDLLVRHLDALAELEQGCGATNRYELHRLEEVVTYLHELVHETVYAQDAPCELLTIPQPMREQELLEI